MSDLISRQAAIDALGEEPMVWCNENEYELGERNQWNSDVLAIKALPTAQPEIIRCKDCKHSFLHDNGERISRICGRTKMCGTTKDDWFCADAERKIDGVDR